MSERNGDDQKTIEDDFDDILDVIKCDLTAQLMGLQDRAYDLGLARGREEMVDELKAAQNYLTVLEEDAERREPQHEKDVLTIASQDRHIEVLQMALSGLYQHTKNDHQIMGLNTAAREALNED